MGLNSAYSYPSGADDRDDDDDDSDVGDDDSTNLN